LTNLYEMNGSNFEHTRLSLNEHSAYVFSCYHFIDQFRMYLTKEPYLSL